MGRSLNRGRVLGPFLEGCRTILGTQKATLIFQNYPNCVCFWCGTLQKKLVFSIVPVIVGFALCLVERRCCGDRRMQSCRYSGRRACELLRLGGCGHWLRIPWSTGFWMKRYDVHLGTLVSSIMICVFTRPTSLINPRMQALIPKPQTPIPKFQTPEPNIPSPKTQNSKPPVHKPPNPKPPPPQ